MINVLKQFQIWLEFAEVFYFEGHSSVRPKGDGGKPDSALSVLELVSNHLKIGDGKEKLERVRSVKKEP